MKREICFLVECSFHPWLIVVLGVAWGFDAWMEFLSLRNSQTFSLNRCDLLVVPPDRLIVGSDIITFGLVCAQPGFQECLGFLGLLVSWIVHFDISSSVYIPGFVAGALYWAFTVIRN